jgi:hypothetical protein
MPRETSSWCACRRHRSWLSNGGNITIDPQFVVLDHSSIIAQAIEGHGGDITINAG